MPVTNVDTGIDGGKSSMFSVEMNHSSICEDFPLNKQVLIASMRFLNVFDRERENEHLLWEWDANLDVTEPSVSVWITKMGGNLSSTGVPSSPKMLFRITGVPSMPKWDMRFWKRSGGICVEGIGSEPSGYNAPF